jgi:amidophosphoribosyltransferase
MRMVICSIKEIFYTISFRKNSEKPTHNLCTNNKFEKDIQNMHGNRGIGVISDFDDQPLIINSHLGVFAITTVGKINNLEDLANEALNNGTHFSEMHGSEISPTELVATIISQGSTFEEGIQKVQNMIDGSCTMLILTEDSIYGARDKLGRTPLIIGEKPDSFAIAMETCAFPNLGYRITKYLGPGEVISLNKNGVLCISLGILWISSF